MEKKRRTRFKHLNLVGEEAGGAFLYSPSQIERARIVQSEKMLAVEQEKEAKIQEKANKKAKKEKKVIETKERVAQREVNRSLVRDIKKEVKRAYLTSKEATEPSNIIVVDKSTIEEEGGGYTVETRPIDQDSYKV
ncbi:hypothetical protein BPAE_0517g00040 [Botrytis paeoniae]|uniref:Uncharacterized protein n=1 Tax=Botrytis paeoniae TaxID=278948 RepID=A0A4Z1F0B2_9HELO|nr:hypothetical protein BPAE_0517g00040 [Botrytis paeoniae]